MKYLILILSILGYSSSFGFEKIDTIFIDDSKTKSYVFYLPEGFTSKTSLFLLDPSARGALPIKKYKSLADQLNIGIFCSNNCKNGPYEEYLAETERMIADAKSRFQLDPDSIFLGGFSGGARAAVNYGFHHSVAGIIGCGSGFPPHFQSRIPAYPYAGVIGIEDMNYLEMKNLFRRLENRNSELFITASGHDWPSAKDMSHALTWLLSLRENSYLKNQIINTERSIVDSLYSKQDLVYAMFWLQKLLSQNSENLLISSEIDSIESLKKYQKENLRLKRIEKAEAEKIDEVLKAFSAIQNSIYYSPSDLKSHEWWRQELVNIQRLKSKGGYRGMSAKRVQGVILTTAYENIQFKRSENQKSQDQEYYWILSQFATQEVSRLYFSLRLAILKEDWKFAENLLAGMKAEGYRKTSFLNDSFFKGLTKNRLEQFCQILD